MVFKEKGTFSILCSVKSVSKKILSFIFPHINSSNYTHDLELNEVGKNLELFFENRNEELIKKMEK